MSIRIRVGAWLFLLLVNALPAAAQSGTTALYIDSQPGDYVGQGLERSWTDADLMFSASVSADRSRVDISTTNAGNIAWHLIFAGPAGTPLTLGLYEYATRDEFQPDHLTTLRVSTLGRACAESIGRFRVHEIVINGGTVERFAVDFEQHCDGVTPALFGAVRYRSTRASLVPFDGAYPIYALHMDAAVNGYVTGPGIDCGAGRTDCDETFDSATTITLTAVPNPGYVFLGWTGFDCVGVATVSVDVNRPKSCWPVFNVASGGSGVEAPNYASNAAFLDGPFGTWDVTPPGGRAQFVSVPPYGRLIASGNPNSVSFDIRHPAIWPSQVSFSAGPSGVLAPGLYQPAFAGVWDAAGPNVGVRASNLICGYPGGRFRIYEITFAGPTLTAFSADFEVPCANGTTTGSIRYNAARASLLPFDGVYPSSTVTVAATLGGYVTSVSGIDCGDGGRTDCEESFEPPTILSLQAHASPGYEFIGWGGICTGTDPIVTMTVKASAGCLAAFHPIAAVPSHPFGNEFLMVHPPGATSSPSLWLPPDASLRVSGGRSSITFWATSVFNRGLVIFGVRAGGIEVGDYDAGPPPFGTLQGLDGRPGTIGVSACTVTHGLFKVYEAVYNPDGTVASFAADFEAYCSGPIPYVAGAVRYRSSRNIVRPFDGAYPLMRLAVGASPYGRVIAPGIACGPIGGDCAETYGTAIVRSIQAIPSPGYAFVAWTGDCSGGSFTQLLVDRTTWCVPLFRAVAAGLPQDPRLAERSLTIRSQPGEPIGGGVSTTYLINSWSVFSDDYGLTLRIFPAQMDWRMNFRAPAGGLLRVGSYEGAVGMSGSLAAPGLSIRRLSSSCDSSNTTGRFTIHEMRFAALPATMIESLALDFEQRCGDGPVLRGSIRHNSSLLVLEPFAGEAAYTFTRFDFTGDQNPDLVWQNVNDGRLLLWHLSGSTYTFNEPPSIPQIGDHNWHIVGTADADGDGYNDLYWQHQTTGALAIWYMHDTQIVTTQAVTPAVSDTNWQIRTIFDVDRDGQPDFIWQHRVSGHIAVWYMNGAAMRSSQLLGPGQIADPNWTIVGAADADGDGHHDLYWHHSTNGQLAIWYMDGVQLLSTQMLTPSTVADTNWRVRGIADINRDGSPDVVWQNVSTSDVAVWMMSGSHLVESRLIGGPTMPAVEWVLVGPR